MATLTTPSASPRMSPHSGSPVKRKITPSFGESPSERSRRTPMSKETLSSVHAGGEIPAQPFFAPKYSGSGSPGSAAPDVRLNLWDRNIDIFAKNIVDKLRDVFPGIVEIGETPYRSQIVFRVKKLPAAPWPSTIGGLPFTISDDRQGRALMFPRQNLGNLSIKICQEGYDIENLSDDAFRALAADVVADFKSRHSTIRVTEIMFTCERTFYIVLGDDVDITATKQEFPGRIAGRLTGYLNDLELCRPSSANWPAKRLLEPQPDRGIFDKTPYKIMRPGVMIRSEVQKGQGPPRIAESTSGVFVENDKHEIFMTGASHRIGRSISLAGDPNADIIGNVASEIPDTDVSLLKLKEGIETSNETFAGHEDNTVLTFTGFFSGTGVNEDPTCYLNSPYTGKMEGSIVMRSIRLEGSEKPNTVLYNWAYTGQIEGNDDRVQPPAGTCGSIIWKDDGLIVGFYHYTLDTGPFQGYSASVSASEVAKAGYSLVTQSRVSAATSA